METPDPTTPPPKWSDPTDPDERPDENQWGERWDELDDEDYGRDAATSQTA